MTKDLGSRQKGNKPCREENSDVKERVWDEAVVNDCVMTTTVFKEKTTVKLDGAEDVPPQLVR